MNPTNPYWQVPLQFEKNISFLKPVTNTLGFEFDLMWPLPVSVGEGYYGQNALPDRRELVYSTQGEYTAIGNTVPSSAGQPLVNLYDPIYKFKRSEHTVQL